MLVSIGETIRVLVCDFQLAVVSRRIHNADIIHVMQEKRKTETRLERTNATLVHCAVTTLSKRVSFYAGLFFALYTLDYAGLSAHLFGLDVVINPFTAEKKNAAQLQAI